MSDMAMKIKVLNVPKSSMWIPLREIIEEGQAASLGNQEYEFHMYSDGCAFQVECDRLGVTYEVVVDSND